MRRLHLVGEKISQDAFLRLAQSSAGRVLFPRLESLSCEVEGMVIASSCFRLFFPPQLKSVILYTRIYALDGIPTDHVEALVHIISLLTNSLEDLYLGYDGQAREPLLEDTLSSFVCRRGSSLRVFDSDIPLSETAIHHLMQLPNIRRVATHEPPRTLPPVIFPSLESLRLKSAVLPWLRLLSPVTHTQRETLETLECPRGTIIDSTLSSSVAPFHNLVRLKVDGYCSGSEGCIFRLTDDDVESLAAALPCLTSVDFVRPCRNNSCETTISSLLSLSIHCLELDFLEIHFNTRTIMNDIRRLLDGGFGCDKAKCRLWCLSAGDVPLEVGEEDIETVVMAFKAIFPCLESCIRVRGRWGLVHHALLDRCT